MSEVNTVFKKSSKQLLSLAKTLKDHKSLEDRVVESLLVKRNVETIKKKKLKHKFAKHPDPLTSESEISIRPVACGYSESSLSFNYNKSGDVSVTHSEHSILSSNFIKCSKPPRNIASSPNQSCSETLITVRARKMEIRDTGSPEPLKKAPRASASTHKLKPPAVGSKLKPGTGKACSRGDAPKNAQEAAKIALQKRNVDHRLRNYLQRILSCVEDIRGTMENGIEPPDGAEDWERTKVRTLEFSARFSRNYLYQLGREVRELQDSTRTSGNISNRTARNIHQRMFSAHQLVLQALVAYRSHMISLLANALAEKLQYVVEQTNILCEIHAKFVNLDQTGSSKREALIDVVTIKCKKLLDKIQESIDKRAQINNTLFSPATRLSLLGYNVNFKRPGKPRPRKKLALEARLSMYSMAPAARTKDAFWKKTVESLAKDKLKFNHVQSRYKTSGFKHRPPPEKPAVIELPAKSKLFGKRSSCLLRNTPISSPRNEDNILTMVEMQKEKECGSSNAPNNFRNEEQLYQPNKNVKNDLHVIDCEQQPNNGENIQLQFLTPLIQEFCQQISGKDGEAMTHKELGSLVTGLRGMIQDGKINNNNDKETGSKKNGFGLQSSAVSEIALKMLQNATRQATPNLDPNANLPIPSKNGELEEIAEAESLKKIESKDKVVENRKSLDKLVRNLKSSTAVSEEIVGASEEKSNNKRNVEEAPKVNKVEFDEVNISQTKKADTGQLGKNKNKRRQTVTITGAKNAQLICIRDEDSIVESPATSKSNPAINKSKEPVKDICSTKGIPAPCEQGEIQKGSKKNTSKLGADNNATSKSKAKEVHAFKSPKVNIKISRLPKKFLKKLVLVPKTQAFNVIQYKLQYSKFTKANHMYRKSSKVQPWEIVDIISEQLMNDLLLSVAREIQVDQILESLYYSEFQ